MNLAAWRWPNIVRLWLIALVLAVLLLVLQYFLLRRRVAGSDTSFFWILPYPSTVSGFFHFAKALARHTPFAALAMLGVPAVTLAVTFLWALSRARRSHPTLRQN